MPTASTARSVVRAAVLEAPRHIALREFPVPPIGPEEALLEIELSGVCGTDHHVSLRLDEIVWKEIRLQGVFIKGSEAIEAANRLLAARGHLYPIERMISHVFPLSRAEEAIEVAGGPWPASCIKAAVAPADSATA